MTESSPSSDPTSRPELRIASARSYLELVHGPAEFGDIYAMWLGAANRPVTSLALLHPQWVSPANREDVYGLRTFGRQPDPLTEACRSQLLWGYECAIADEPLHSDHLFPYGLGGCTTGMNRIVLCAEHNQMKAGDIHVYPWERAVESWVCEAIDRIVRFRSSL